MTTATGSKKSERGFTLVELMITVAIIAVLALLAVIGYSRWSLAAKTAEATAMIGSIKGQEETYRAETLTYLDCSGAQSLAATYPAAAPSNVKQVFDVNACGGNAVCLSFQKLHVTGNGPVYYDYSCAAGPANGVAVAGFAGHVYGNANDVWFITRAIGDLNNNGVQATYESSSFDSTIWSVNPEE